jgi:hypothetical protein
VVSEWILFFIFQVKEIKEEKELEATLCVSEIVDTMPLRRRVEQPLANQDVEREM